MKKLLTTLLIILLAGTALKAQKSFEGEIAFTVKLQGEGADMMSAFMPESYHYLINKTDMKFWMKGGMTAAMMGEMYVSGDKGTAYMVKHDEQIAYKMPMDEESDDHESDEAKPVVEKMNETMTILGHSCQKYKVTTTNESGEEVIQYYFMTEDIHLAKVQGRAGADNTGGIMVEGLNGFPMMIISTMDMEGQVITMKMTVSKIDEREVDPEEVSVPANYEVRDFDPDNIFGN